MISNTDRVRVVLTGPRKRMDELDELANNMGLESKAEVISYAITLFAYAIDEIKDGKVITTVDERDGTYKIISMPAFDNIRVHPKSLDDQADILADRLEDRVCMSIEDVDHDELYQIALLMWGENDTEVARYGQILEQLGALPDD